MKKLTYYPGCSGHGSSKEFEKTVKLSASKLDVELQEVPDWNCCGASSAHYLNETLGYALPIRNLAIAENMGNDTIASPCPSCYMRLKATQHDLAKNPTLQDKIVQVLEKDEKYTGNIAVKSILQYFYEDIGLEAIKEKVVKPLTGLKVACYYGCLMTRPKEITQFDSPEYPISMDKIMEAVGATATDFDYKTECCGASYSISNTEVMQNMIYKILDVAKQSGADAVVVACPLCQSNLDMRQKDMESAKKAKFNLPVFYFTQLIALAFGFNEKEIELNRHLVDTTEVLKKYNLI